MNGHPRLEEVKEEECKELQQKYLKKVEELERQKQSSNKVKQLSISEKKESPSSHREVYAIDI